MKNIDEMAVELAKKANLKKAMPPKLKYKFMKWLKSMKPEFDDKQTDRRRAMETAKSELISKIAEMRAVSSLAKNEVMASTFDDGAIKFDFGSDVPDHIKKAAFGWAKKKGLRATEASLAKSKKSPTAVMFANGNNSSRNCKRRVKWVVE